jgi:hypothetical protein
MSDRGSLQLPWWDPGTRKAMGWEGRDSEDVGVVWSSTVFLVEHVRLRYDPCRVLDRHLSPSQSEKDGNKIHICWHEFNDYH